MITNDIFFRQCWLDLKARRPRLRKEMDKIELMVGATALYYPAKARPQKPTDEQPQKGQVL